VAHGPGDNSIPWLAWGPDLRADGTTPRSDGLTWACPDFSSSDGTHPSASGQQKVAQMLLTFFQTDSTARAWYLWRDRHCVADGPTGQLHPHEGPSTPALGRPPIRVY